jgi:hypothetical protein
MSIVSSRRSAPLPATASASLVTAVHTHLQCTASGLSLPALADKARFPQNQVADAISVAVDTGLVRFDLSSTAMQFYAAEHKALPSAAPVLVNHVMHFIAAQEDFERGSPDVVIAPEVVVDALKDTYSVDQVLAAFDTLRLEEILWFRLNPTTGRATVTLSRHRIFTVIGRDNDACEALCFYVRAGNAALAIRKVEESAYGGDDLALFGITEGEIEFQPPKRRAMLVERL